MQTVEIVGKRPEVGQDEVRIKVDGSLLQGWLSVRITRGIERCPNDFEVTCTERYPDDPDAMVIRPGDPCEVLIGRDTVLTGYVDRYAASISDGHHSISISGRGKCQDLVDCAAKWEGNQIVSASVLEVARRLADPYKIKAFGAEGPAVGQAGSKLFPYVVITIGETAWQVIERLCRIAGLLAYEQTDGNLFITNGVHSLSEQGTQSNALLQGIDAPFPTGVAASGFKEGVNVIEAEIALSMHERYSEYAAYLWNLRQFQELSGFPNLIGTAEDPGVLRFRNHVTIAELGREMSVSNARDRAQWEATRRWGRSHELRLRTDSWRDAEGKLYTPNTLVPLELPTLKVTGVSWLISEVTYMKDDNGTSCELLIMPWQAFSMRPELPEYALPAEVFKAPLGSAQP